MAEQPSENASETAEADEQIESLAPLAGDADGVASRWSGVWQLPVLLAGLTLLALGTWSALPERVPDDFPGALDSVEQFLEAKKFDEARDHLETIHENALRATDSERARYVMLRGDLIYLRQQELGWDKAENHDQILRLYGKAKQLGQPMDERHLQRWIYTLVALGQDDEAMGMLDQLAERRHLVIGKVIERRSALPEPDRDELFELLARFNVELRRETDAAARREQELWAAELKSQLLIDDGRPDQAIGFLLPNLVRLDTAAGDADGGEAEEELVPLILNLAQAY